LASSRVQISLLHRNVERDDVLAAARLKPHQAKESAEAMNLHTSPTGN
jgi:hypothetical protein